MIKEKYTYLEMSMIMLNWMA